MRTKVDADQVTIGDQLQTLDGDTITVSQTTTRTVHHGGYRYDMTAVTTTDGRRYDVPSALPVTRVTPD